MITFLNQPTLSTHEIYSESNKRRLTLVPHVEALVREHPLFKDKDVTIFFPSIGSGSLTCIIDAGSFKKVLKIQLSAHSFYKYEGTFLKAWESVGVKVPQVIEEGAIDTQYYLLMEFVEAPTLRDVYHKGEMIRKEIYVKMGQLLRQMHEAQSKGFGALKASRGMYGRFDEWLEYELEKKKELFGEVSFLKDEKHGNLDHAVTILNEFVGDSENSNFCHNDFAYQNIFATEPLTVFDPIPVLSHPYMDLARAIVTALGRGLSDQAADHLIRGYSGNDLELNRKVLQAALTIQSYLKFGFWSKTGKEQGVKDVLVYLEKTKEKLG